jgi:sphinganine-1-phosphate aldolase
MNAADPYEEPGAGLKKWGGIYHSTGRRGEDGQLQALQAGVARTFMSTNALYAGLWPSVAKFEREIVQMTVSLLHGTEDTVGLLASGGTEAILLPMLG